MTFPHGPRNFGSVFSKDKSTTFTSAQPTSFCYTEFERALKEQAFGIKSFAMVSSSPRQATAFIVILEGSKLPVHLTTQGYSVGVLPFPRFFAVLITLAQISTTNSDSTRVYETIEDLLQAASPLYTKRRQEVLYAELAKFS